LKYLEKDRRLKFNIDEVLFVNTERKNLPFRESANAKIKMVSTWKEFEAVLKAGCGLMDFKDKEKADYYNPIKFIAIDSFTRMTFLLSEHLDRNNITGFSFWADFGKTIQRLLYYWEGKGRFIVFTAIEENIRDGDGIDTKCVKVDGKILENKVESFFTVCLHTHFNPVKQSPECYQFETQSDGRNTAKSPEGMFDNHYIQNDMSKVLGSYYWYYDMGKNKDFVPSPIIIYGKSGSGKSSSFKYLFQE
jgi:Cdc6-like AAA superfamily ATPase